MSWSLIAERFRHVCRDRSSAVAVHDLGDRSATTFDDLFAQYEAIRRAFDDAGVGAGSLVVSLVGNRTVFFPLFVASFEAGATLLPLGETTASEAVALITHSGAGAVVTDRPLPIAAAGGEHPLPGATRLLVLDPALPSPLAAASGAVLKRTSGSTDLPMAAVATEAQIVNDGRHVVDAMAIDARDVNLACIPLSHSYALGNIVLPLVTQGTAAAVRQSFNPAQFRADVDAAGVTVFPGVPFMFERLNALPAAPAPRGLRLLITAGAPIGIQTVRRFWEGFGRKIHSFYGSSETGGIAYDDAEQLDDLVHVGRPMPETTVTIRDAVPGLPGRVFISGNAVCDGYAGRLDTSAAAFVDGGFLSTDLGMFDGHGRLVLTGRVSALVNVAGRKVDPVEVERVLRGLPDILDARVLGTECDRRGEQLAAVVVRGDGGLTAATIRKRCAAVLSAYKIPRRFVFVDELPVDDRGKVDRRTLEALVTADADS